MDEVCPLVSQWEATLKASIVLQLPPDCADSHVKPADYCIYYL
jgi:hypothetical protein